MPKRCFFLCINTPSKTTSLHIFCYKPSHCASLVASGSCDPPEHTAMRMQYCICILVKMWWCLFFCPNTPPKPHSAADLAPHALTPCKLDSIRLPRSSGAHDYAHAYWAARYNTWLLVELTPKGVVFSFFSFLRMYECNCILPQICQNIVLGCSPTHPQNNVLAYLSGLPP